jgi:hypothetical protein
MKKSGTEVKPEDLKIVRDEKGQCESRIYKVNDSKDRKTENKIELKLK